MRRPIIPLVLGLSLLTPIIALLPQPRPYPSSPNSHPTPSARPSAPKPNLVLITLDTTRADHLPCYGYAQPTMPFLCHLAKQAGIRFTRAFSPVPLTLPAHATILTGRQPHQHHLLDNGLMRLPTSIPTLAERLKARGYHTRAYVASVVLDRVYGLNRGFDVYNDDVRVGRRSAFGYRERAANQVVNAVLADQPATWPRPVFLWVHFYDPHDPYIPPEPFRSRFENPYDGELAFVDAMLKRLLTNLQRMGVFAFSRDALVIVGDHGEDLGDHGELRHGLLLTPATLHVPLIVLPPKPWPMIPHSTFFPLNCITPLLLRFASPHPTSATSPAEPLCGQTVTTLATFMPYHTFRWSPLVGLLRWPWLFVHGHDDELYHLEQDPSASHNRASDNPQVLESLKKALRHQWPDFDHPSVPQPDPTLMEKLETLRSLGYAGQTAPGPPVNPFTLPPPKTRVYLYRQFLKAKDLIQNRQWTQARTVLTRLLKKDPMNTLVLNNLATVYEALGEIDRAERTLVKVTELLPMMDYPWVQLGAFYRRHRHFNAALDALKTALERNPRNATAYLEWFHTLMQQRQIPQARMVLKRAIAAGVNDPDLLMFQAIFSRGDGNLAKANHFIQEALNRNPTEPAYHLEFLRIACDTRNANPTSCETTLETEFKRLGAIPDFWVVAAKFYGQQNQPAVELYCWQRAASLPGLRRDHRRQLQRRLHKLSLHNLTPTPPPFAQ